MPIQKSLLRYKKVGDRVLSEVENSDHGLIKFEEGDRVTINFF